MSNRIGIGIDVFGAGKIAKLILDYFARVIAASGVTEGKVCLSNSLSSLDSKQLLDNASLVLIPSGYKESVLFSQVPTSGLGDLDVVRATTATRVNSAGLIELVPRNLLQYSNILTNAVWTKTNSTITSGQVSPTQPNNEGWLLNKTATGVDGLVYNAFNLNSLTTHSYSYYILKDNNETRFPEFFLRLNTGQVEQYVQVNTKTGAFSVRVASAGCTQSITSTADNLWWRLILTNPAPTAFTADNRHGVRPAAATVLGVYNINATGSVITYGAQVEEGTTVTEYLPTVTRLNFPRLDYTNSSCPSLLVEPQRTNVLNYSNEFTNGVWVKVAGSTVTTDLSVQNPSGITPSFRFNASNVAFGGILRQVLSLTVGQPYTISFFVKKGNYRYVGIRFNNSINGQRYPTYDFDTDTLNKQGVTCDLSRTILTNGWVRLNLTFTAGIITSNCDIALTTSNGDTSTALAGTEFMYVYGSQVELGSYQTSYIPTGISTVTRNADTIQKTGITSLIGQTEGTLYTEIKVTQLLGALSRYIFHVSDGTANNRIYIAFSGASSNILRGRIFNGGTLQCSIDTSTITNTGTYKLALGYKNNDIVFYVNGVQIGVDTSANIPACSRVDVGSNYAGASQLSDGVSNAILYKTRLTNSELATLTTI
jgi:hypothetical protein